MAEVEADSRTGGTTLVAEEQEKGIRVATAAGAKAVPIGIEEDAVNGMRHGKKHGPWKTHYWNGQLEFRRTYKDGELHGPWEHYDKNGQLSEKGTYNMGEKCGAWTDEGKTVNYPPCAPGLGVQGGTAEPDFQAYLWTSYASLEGRISRQTYLLKFLVPIAVALRIGFFLDVAWGSRAYESNIGLLSGTVLLMAIWPVIAGTVKRLHDRDTSGWAIPVFWGLLALGLMLSLVAGDSLGAWVMVGIFSLGVGFFGIHLSIEVAFRRGTEGTNRYGPDPLKLPRSDQEASPVPVEMESTDAVLG